MSKHFDCNTLKFWNRKRIDSNTHCWNYTGFVDKIGYGSCKRVCGTETIVGAHRVAYYLTHGPFDFSRHVLHKCDNRKCINPDHLFLGDQLSNMQDKVNKKRQKRSHDTYNAAFTPKQKADILKQYKFGVRGCGATTIAKRYGVCHQTILNLVKKYTYKD